MLTGNYQNLRGAKAAGARPVMVAPFAPARVIAVKTPIAHWAWPVRGQRERE